MRLAAFALAAGVAGATLGGCASSPSEQQPAIPPPASAVPGPGSAATAGGVGLGTPMTGGDTMTSGSMTGTPDSRLSGMDLLAMCDLNRQISQAKTPEARQALIERVLPNTSPEVRERHLQLMQQRCDGTFAPASPGSGQ
jgi:hypothetical protein